MRHALTLAGLASLAASAPTKHAGDNWYISYTPYSTYGTYPAAVDGASTTVSTPETDAPHSASLVMGDGGANGKVVGRNGLMSTGLTDPLDPRYPHSSLPVYDTYDPYGKYGRYSGAAEVAMDRAGMVGGMMEGNLSEEKMSDKGDMSDDANMMDHANMADHTTTPTPEPQTPPTH
ncbi:hypothetical protein BDU57DRAFT_183158 [Ampelomyces quisqualis]|uniref:Uncharacterized protein n=1 Tax=Ampelomyces quisqualis TaxID=50730 RepID=A0A6A5QT02_AMPQU|nr:hypothetical protein BDU57DRAFT_183158 [Ampelomyces quisqualis]